jgi:hypothetical protein
VCPVAEGALVRFLVRIGESAGVAKNVLRAIHALPGCEFLQSVPHRTLLVPAVR